MGGTKTLFGLILAIIFFSFFSFAHSVFAVTHDINTAGNTAGGKTAFKTNVWFEIPAGSFSEDYVNFIAIRAQYGNKGGQFDFHDLNDTTTVNYSYTAYDGYTNTWYLTGWYFGVFPQGTCSDGCWVHYTNSANNNWLKSSVSSPITFVNGDTGYPSISLWSSSIESGGGDPVVEQVNFNDTTFLISIIIFFLFFFLLGTTYAIMKYR